MFLYTVGYILEYWFLGFVRNLDESCIPRNPSGKKSDNSTFSDNQLRIFVRFPSTAMDHIARILIDINIHCFPWPGLIAWWVWLSISSMGWAGGGKQWFNSRHDKHLLDQATHKVKHNQAYKTIKWCGVLFDGWFLIKFSDFTIFNLIFVWWHEQTKLRKYCALLNFLIALVLLHAYEKQIQFGCSDWMIISLAI